LLLLLLLSAVVDEVLPPAFLASCLPSLPDGGLGITVVQATGGMQGHHILCCRFFGVAQTGQGWLKSAMLNAVVVIVQRLWRFFGCCFEFAGTWTANNSDQWPSSASLPDGGLGITVVQATGETCNTA
jgi:hypothetical protein